MSATKSIYPNKENDSNSDPITLYTLSNKAKTLIVKIIDYGATIVQILFHDQDLIQRNVVLGYDNLNNYRNSNYNRSYFGATIGRVSNRIANGSFYLNGHHYQLYQNNGPNSLHGGQIGFDKRKWELISNTPNLLKLKYRSPDGEENYPGTLITTITFTVTESNELKIKYEAKLEEPTDISTILSLTNHSYFNLNGNYDEESSKIFDHKVRIYSDYFLEVDSDLIPTGNIKSVIETPLEFNSNSKIFTIGERNFHYDHSFVLYNDPTSQWKLLQIPDRKIKLAAEIYSSRTGIRLTFSTNEPSFQFYTGEYIQPFKHAQNSFTLGPNSGFALEAQRFTNAINVDKWKNQVILKGKDEYSQETIYKFDICKNFN